MKVKPPPQAASDARAEPIAGGAEAAAPPTPREERVIQFALVVMLLLTYLYIFPRWADLNQNSRLNLTLALVREGRVEVDSFHENTGDKAFYRGHWYSEKPVGTSLLALLPVAAMDHLTALPPVYNRLERINVGSAMEDSLSPEGAGVGAERVRYFLALVAATAFCVALPVALLGGLLFTALRHWLPGPTGLLTMTGSRRRRRPPGSEDVGIRTFGTSR